MNNNDLNALANDLLTCYFDGADVYKLNTIAKKHRVTIGSKIFNKGVERGIGWMESGDTSQMNETNKQKMFQSGIKGISKRFGVEFGKDFSMAPDGGLMMKSELVDRIMADMPADKVAQFKAMGYVQKVSHDGFQMLEDNLGVPFFAELDRIAKLTAKRLNNAELNVYINIVWNGLSQRHQFIGDEWAVRFAHRITSDKRLLELRDADSNSVSDERETDIRVVVMTDLLIALGDKEGNNMRQFSDGMQPTLSLDQMRLLDKVVRFGDYSFAYVAAELEASLKRNK